MREVVQVFEHEVLRVDEHGLTEAAFDALVRFNQRHEDQFFTVRHRSLKFANYVGVLQVGGLTVEVLPKADRGSAGDKKKWRNALIDMLRSCGYLKLAAASTAHLHLRRASLFDLYMEAFLTEVRALLHHGLVRKYRQVTGNLTALKGRLVFNRHIAENLVHRERFFTAYNHYDRNNRFNQILHLAVRIVSTSARSSAVRGAADELLVWMEGIDDKPVSAETFARLRLDRNTERYRPAMALAKMIILNYQPDLRAGGHDVLAILFDMNELFEEYVLRQLKRAAYGYGVEVHGQYSQRFWCARRHHSEHSTGHTGYAAAGPWRSGNGRARHEMESPSRRASGRCGPETDVRVQPSVRRDSKLPAVPPRRRENGHRGPVRGPSS